MMWLVATFVSAFVFGIASFLLKFGSHKQYAEASMLLGLYLAGSTIFLITLIVNDYMMINGLIVLFALLVGLGSYFGNSFLVKAYDLGPACLTSPLMSLSVLLVILLSAFVYNEEITAWQYAGVTCMMIAASLLGCNFNSTLIKSRMWLVFVVLAIIALFMREGSLKIAQETGLNNIGVLFFSYLFAALLSMLTFISKNKKTTNETVKHRYALFLGAIVGICSAIGMGLLAFALTQGPASVIVPIFSARNVITVLLIVVFFKEKLLKLQWTAVGLMILGTVFVS
jgi:drug/metabolite transporter (DMT)-like permease